MKRNILDGISSTDVRMEPYPHIVVRKPFSDPIYSTRMSVTFPKLEHVAGECSDDDNVAYRIRAKDSIVDNSITDEWKEFVYTHTSKEFYSRIFDVFDKAIKHHYPIEYKSLKSPKTGIRFTGKYDVSMDCQFVVNTPSTGSVTVRDPHVDSPIELYAGLWYLRDKYDDSSGGALNLYEIKDEEHKFFGKNSIKPEFLSLVDTVEYDSDVVVFFLNTKRSVHGVSVRAKTGYHRKYMNIIGETQSPMFKVRY